MDCFTRLQQNSTISQVLHPFPVVILVGNKADLAENRQVTRETAERFATDKRCPYLECSAFGDCDDVFNVTLRELRKQKEHSKSTML